MLWGDPADDPDCATAPSVSARRGSAMSWSRLPPDRGRTSERRADYHDPALPPRHALVAFGLWLRHVVKVDALVHMGAHGTLEWLPGKAVALTAACFPEVVTGALPVIYPFIVCNPGEAAQAKRRIAGVTIGHLPPPLVEAGLSGAAHELERLVDEYAIADGLDRRRRERLARLIVETAPRAAGSRARPASRPASTPTTRCAASMPGCATSRTSPSRTACMSMAARGADSDDPAWAASAAAEREALIAALDGKRVAPGPAGSPQRGRRDVLPTGRNLFTADPRTLPTPTAYRSRPARRRRGDPPLSADARRDAALSRHRSVGQRHAAHRRRGDRARPRADGLPARCGTAAPAASPASRCCRAPRMGRPRVDVTWRISGLFRDLFPAQIALIDAAVKLVAARDEDDEENPLAAAVRASHGASSLARIFGNAPGAYGAGVEDLLGRDMDRDEVGAAYLAAASHAYGGADGEGARCRAASPRASPPPIFSCTAATTRRAICSKARRMRPSSAALPRRPRRSATRRI